MSEVKIPSNKVKRIYELDVNESNIARIYQHIKDHDCAILTAWRSRIVNCIEQCELPEGHELTRRENLARNGRLLNSLRELGYGVTSVDGSWIENYGETDEAGKSLEKEGKENSFFVCNDIDDPKFVYNIINFGKFYCQDCVLIKERGSDEAYTEGTNNHKYDYIPKLGEKKPSGIFQGGITGKLMSRIRNRPFKFEAREDINILARQYTNAAHEQEMSRVQTMLDHLAKG